MIDVVITTYNRVTFLKQTVESLVEMNRECPFRLFIADDCSTDGTRDYLIGLRKLCPVELYLGGERRGLAFNLSVAWKLSSFFDSFLMENDYLCYLQDDMISMGKEWLLTAIRAYEKLGKHFNIGFFSGVNAPEHPIESVEPWEDRCVYIKQSNSGKNMIGEKSFWLSIGRGEDFIPRDNPDGSQRGMPNNGRGSCVDVWLEGCYSGSKFEEKHASENCLYNQGKKILVIPELLSHIGDNRHGSTWRSGKEFAITLGGLE